LELGTSGETVAQEFDEVKEKFDETFQLFFQPA
jgi:hypothetical protein